MPARRRAAGSVAGGFEVAAGRCVGRIEFECGHPGPASRLHLSPLRPEHPLQIPDLGAHGTELPGPGERLQGGVRALRLAPGQSHQGPGLRPRRYAPAERGLEGIDAARPLQGQDQVLVSLFGDPIDRSGERTDRSLGVVLLEGQGGNGLATVERGAVEHRTGIEVVPRESGCRTPQEPPEVAMGVRPRREGEHRLPRLHRRFGPPLPFEHLGPERRHTRILPGARTRGGENLHRRAVPTQTHEFAGPSEASDRVLRREPDRFLEFGERAPGPTQPDQSRRQIPVQLGPERIQTQARLEGRDRLAVPPGGGQRRSPEVLPAGIGSEECVQGAQRIEHGGGFALLQEPTPASQSFLVAPGLLRIRTTRPGPHGEEARAQETPSDRDPFDRTRPAGIDSGHARPPPTALRHLVRTGTPAPHNPGAADTMPEGLLRFQRVRERRDGGGVRSHSRGTVLRPTGWVPAFLGALCLTALVPVLARAASRTLFDFEGPYFVDPGRTIKDHAMVHDGQNWHLYYIRGDETVPGTASETQFGHATSPDLSHWTPLADALSVSTGGFDARNVWAPQVLTTPGGTDWTMFYTGVDAARLQRMGAASSTDLQNWMKWGTNPLLEPDSTVYWFDPAVNWLAAFRDPFFFEEGGQFHVLNTALLRDDTLPAGYRGAIHHAVATDLTQWTELPPLALNNSRAGASREIESVQLIKASNGWNLFFTLSFMEGVRWTRSDSLTGSWDIDSAIEIDGGVAAELTPISADTWLFTRHTADVHGMGHPNAGEIFYVLRADTLRFHPTAGTPVITRSDPLAANWPVRTGNAFLAVPTFGDNPLERGEPHSNLVGHGFLSSREYYAGPLSGFGVPGLDSGIQATGEMISRPFTIAPSDSLLRFLHGGSIDPGCRIELIETLPASDGGDSTVVHASVSGNGQSTMGPATFDLVPLRGRTLQLRIVDESTLGWICLDHVQVIDDGGDAPTPAPSPRSRTGRLLPNRPNPFNPRTEIRFRLDAPARVHLGLFDLRGRRLRRVDLGRREAGDGSWIFDARDDQGRPLASGVYLLHLDTDGRDAGTRKITLVR